MLRGSGVRSVLRLPVHGPGQTGSIELSAYHRLALPELRCRKRANDAYLPQLRASDAVFPDYVVERRIPA